MDPPPPPLAFFLLTGRFVLWPHGPWATKVPERVRGMRREMDSGRHGCVRRSLVRAPKPDRPCRVRKPRHATREYSWTTPPRRSRREIRASPNADADAAPARLVTGGASDSTRSWPVPVVVVDEHFKIRSRSCWFRISSQSRHSVRTVRTNRSATPLACGARNGVLMTSSPSLRNKLVKPIGEFLIPIANQKPHRFRALGQGPRQLPGLLDDPWCTRVRRATGHMHTPAAQLDEEEDVEPLQPDRLDRDERRAHVKKSTANRLWRCARTNSRHVVSRRLPAGPRPAARSHARTVVAETEMPRPFSSPTIRG
jgi:hypothetical protein